MKGILILFLAIIACEAMTVRDPPEDFVKGFLEAIHEKKTVEDLKPCLKNMDKILAKVKAALELIMKFKFEDIVKGLKLLIEAFEDLKKMLEPCLKDFTQLQLLFKKMKEANIIQIAYRIIANAKDFIKDITECIEALKKLDLYKAGKCIGDIMYRLFLARFTKGNNNLQLFVEGFLEGIHEKKTIDDLLKCMKNTEQILAKIQKALELILKFTIESLLEGFSLLFEAIKDLHAMLEPCIKDFPQFKKLIEAIINADINKIIAKIMSDPFSFIADIVDCYKALMAGEYKRAGKDIGDVLFRLFLDKMLVMKPFDVVAFLKGFLRGLNEKGDIGELLKCANGIEKIVPKIIEAINLLKRIDFEHMADIIKGLTLLFQAITELLQILQPCMKGFAQLAKLFEALKHIDIMKIVMKILTNPQPIIQDVMECIEAFKKEDWEKAGWCIGDLLLRIFLTGR